mmetsp:Transcript_28243/g.69837  ORF Transcript_28243/g.69837 Transcript_28243/m.69837 type:complete len:348 (+) Transcript_28243:70-1113(+)
MRGRILLCALLGSCWAAGAVDTLSSLDPFPPFPPIEPLPPLPPPPASCPSFADFAKQYGIPTFEETKGAIDGALGVDEDSILPANVHDCRKALLKMRTFLDVFGPAYSPVKDDMYGQFRYIVDKGYETVGNFQDLDHMGEKYSFKEMRRLRKGVVEWYAEYLPMEQQFRALLQHPSSQMHAHKHASRFFWGHEGAEGPSEHLNGMQNMHRLMRTQLAYAHELCNNSLHLPEIFSEAAHERMHDFRKSLRALMHLHTMFNQSPWQDEQPAVAMAFAHFEKMYDGYGDANDLRNGYLHAIEDGDYGEASRTARELEEAWLMLKTMQIDLEILKDIHELREHMSPNCTYP